MLRSGASPSDLSALARGLRGGCATRRHTEMDVTLAAGEEPRDGLDRDLVGHVEVQGGRESPGPERQPVAPGERNDHVSPEIRLHRLLNAYPSQVEGKRSGVEQLPLPGPADQVRRTAGCGTARTGRSSSGDARDSSCVPKAPFGGVSPSSTLRGSLGPTAPHRALRDSHPCRAPACAGASGSHVASRRLTRSSFGTKKSWVRIPPFRKLKYQGRGPSVQVALAPLALLCGYRS